MHFSYVGFLVCWCICAFSMLVMAIEWSQIKEGSLANYFFPLSIRKSRIDGDLQFALARLRKRAVFETLNRRNTTVLARGLMRCIIRPIENSKQIDVSLQYPLSFASFLVSFAIGALVILFAPDATWRFGNPMDLLGLGLYVAIMFLIPLGALYYSCSLAKKCFDEMIASIDGTNESMDEPSDAPKSPVGREFKS